MKIKIPNYKKIITEKIFCLNCKKKIDRYDSSVEITFTVWINGYTQIISQSNYYCDDCSAKGFDVKPIVGIENESAN